MKAVLLSIILIFQLSPSAHANSCMESVLGLFYVNYDNIPDDYQVGEATKSCLAENDEFKSVMETVCNAKGSLSNEYEVYNGYAQDFKSKLKERDASISESQRTFLNSELRAIENDWMIFGFRWELSPTLSTVFDLVNGDCWTEKK